MVKLKYKELSLYDNPEAVDYLEECHDIVNMLLQSKAFTVYATKTSLEVLRDGSVTTVSEDIELG